MQQRERRAAHGWSEPYRSPRSAPAKEEDAVSVSQAIDIAAGALDRIPQLCVLGEVTGFRGPNARSGHCYFQIKDDSSAMDCIIWKGTYLKRAFDLRDGMQVHLTGSFNLYKAQGKMRFVARSFSLAGEGILRQQVAALAEKLRREGLMDESRRRRIPAFCSRVAVVTSLSGAVIDDVKRTLRRRNPLVRLSVVGSKVQGEGAPEELIEGLRRAAAITPAPDCILLVRGGGSFEDLMTFNDESLARAVAACPVPVVTGIGHEPDTSICDMVGDRRCSTPTAAAESVAPAITELAELLAAREHRLVESFTSMAASARADLDASSMRASRAMTQRLAQMDAALAASASRPCLMRPAFMVEQRSMDLARSAERFSSALVQSPQQRYARELDALSPRLVASTSGLAAKRHALELAASRLSTAGPAMLRTLPAARLRRAPPAGRALAVGRARARLLHRVLANRVATSTSAFARDRSCAFAWRTATCTARSTAWSRPAPRASAARRCAPSAEAAWDPCWP